MAFSDVLLIIISGLGTIHGLFLAIFLWWYEKGHRLSNRILSLLLLVLTFRIGKSVFLEFADNIVSEVIFIGLGSMLAIGPLFYLFAKSALDQDFEYRAKQILHFIFPFIGIVLGAFLSDGKVETLPILFFIVLFLSYYFQFLIYLIIGLGYINKKKRQGASPQTVALLKLLNYSLFAIWIVYFLNLLDEVVPYVLGPILYSLIAYIVSIVVIKKEYLQNIHKTKYATTKVSNETTDRIFEKVVDMMEAEKLFKDPNISLGILSERLKITPQILSKTINEKTHKNYNAFINQYRIKEATDFMKEDQSNSYTILAIAYEVGFNSLSSFNTNFKNIIGKSPKKYREAL